MGPSNRPVISADPQQKKDFGYHLTEHLRLNGVYWGLTALFIMSREDALDRAEMIHYVKRCWDEEAGMSSCSFASLRP